MNTENNKELTIKELHNLRNQIVLGSIFINDYENDMGVDKNRACNFFFGYEDWLYEENRLESDENLYEFYLMCGGII